MQEVASALHSSKELKELLEDVGDHIRIVVTITNASNILLSIEHPDGSQGVSYTLEV